MNPTSPSNSPFSFEAQIREAAYFQWLDRGCPVGDDWAHWFAAEQRLRAAMPASPIQEMTIDAPRSMPAPRPAHPAATLQLHASPGGHDHRPEVLASGTGQRTRARRHTGRAPNAARSQPRH